MFRVAICTEAEAEAKRLSALADTIFEDRHIEAETVCFWGGARGLLKTVRDGAAQFDAYFLEVYLDGSARGGIEAANRLRTMGEKGLLILMSADTGAAFDGYKVQADDYLLKPVGEDVLEESLMRLLRKRKTVMLRTPGGGYCILDSRQILWAESFLHKTEIHTTEQTHTVRMILGEVLETLGKTDFIRCHRSYFVNLAYVAEIGKTTLKLTDGTELPISRGSMPVIQSALAFFHDGGNSFRQGAVRFKTGFRS